MNIRLLLLPAVLLATIPIVKAATISVDNALDDPITIIKDAGGTSTQDLAPQKDKLKYVSYAPVDNVGSTFSIKVQNDANTTCKDFTVYSATDAPGYSVKWEDGLIVKTDKGVQKCGLPTIRVSLGQGFSSNNKVTIQIPGQPDISLDSSDTQKITVPRDISQFTAIFGQLSATKNDVKPGGSYRLSKKSNTITVASLLF